MHERECCESIKTLLKERPPAHIDHACRATDAPESMAAREVSVRRKFARLETLTINSDTPGMLLEHGGHVVAVSIGVDTIVVP